MKKLVYLSCDNLEGYITDDHLTLPLLKERGWSVDTLSWTASTDWSLYDAVIIRTTWDYTQNLDRFLQKLHLISTQTRLINSFETVNWNAIKNYLGDLQNWGLPTLPTVFEWPDNWTELFKIWDTEKIMIKPQIGASSVGTHIVTMQNIPNSCPFPEAPLIQPFCENIFSEGEMSFHFFNGRFSHAVRKIPKMGDYRVQEEYGGQIRGIEPTRFELDRVTEMYKLIESKLRTRTLFHRVDVVKNKKSQLEIMEVELIEPSLYFRTNTQAPLNFVEALIDFI